MILIHGSSSTASITFVSVVMTPLMVVDVDMPMMNVSAVIMVASQSQFFSPPRAPLVVLVAVVLDAVVSVSDPRRPSIPR